MNPKNDLTQSGQPRPTLSPAPRKRFRLEKLEERIAPVLRLCGHYNPNTKWVGHWGFCE
jgi:hypothetical protein